MNRRCEFSNMTELMFKTAAADYYNLKPLILCCVAWPKLPGLPHKQILNQHVLMFM